MSTFMLKSGDDSPFAAMIRAACGFSASENVEVTTPTFNRPAAWEPAMLPPETSESWQQLQRLTRDQLHTWGCRAFSLFRDTPPPNSNRASHRDAWFWAVDEASDGATHELWLFPAEWYTAIPSGFPVVDINGCLDEFTPGRSDDDRRFGMLAYGLMIRYQPEVPQASSTGDPQ